MLKNFIVRSNQILQKLGKNIFTPSGMWGFRLRNKREKLQMRLDN